MQRLVVMLKMILALVVAKKSIKVNYTFLGMSPQEAHGTEVQQTAGAHPCPIVIALVSKHDILQLGQP